MWNERTERLRERKGIRYFNTLHSEKRGFCFRGKKTNKNYRFKIVGNLCETYFSPRCLYVQFCCKKKKREKQFDIMRLFILDARKNPPTWRIWRIKWYVSCRGFFISHFFRVGDFSIRPSIESLSIRCSHSVSIASSKSNRWRWNGEYQNPMLIFHVD